MTHKLYQLITELEKRKIHFFMSRLRNDSIMLTCTIVGMRMEVDVFEDGHIEYSEFKGDESVLDDETHLRNLMDSHV